VTRGVFNLEGIQSPLDYDQDEDYGGSPNMTFAQIIDTYLLPCAFNGVGSFGNYSNEEQINLLVEENNQRHYATLSKHYAKNPFHIKAVVDATRVMQKMRDVQSAFSDYISADTLSIKSELNVWSKRSMVLGIDHVGAQTGGILAGNIVAGHLNNINANDTLKSLERENPLDEEFYTLEGCIEEMENIIARAEEKYTSTHDDTIKPSVEWYNHMLASYGRSDLKDASAKAKQMLRGMEAYEDDHVEDEDNFRPCWAKPDLISYNSLLFCLARDGSEVRPKEVLELFEKLKSRYERTQNEIIRPDEVTYGSVLHALAQVGMAQEAQAILDTIEEEGSVTPTLTIYNTVLNAYANSFERGAPRRAEMLLDRMKKLSATGEYSNIEPDIVSISTVMACHARSKKRANAERAEELLDQAIESYSLGNAKMKPDSIMFNCAILAWAHCSSPRDEWDRSGRLLAPPAERAEMLLHKLLDLRESNTLEIAPVAQTINLVLDSWAKSARKDAGDRALKLMRDMSKFGVTADECSYNSVLNAMSKQGDAQSIKEALTVFRELQELSRNGHLTISDLTYNVMINVYGKSNDKDGARHAENLLRTMENDGIQPTIISYNSCIDAYARRGDVAKAESLIDEMVTLSEQGREDFRPTIHSYAALINAVANSPSSDSIDRGKAQI
jgi:pentatricopeptide repeat protein